jgi:hypothetical protein
MTGRPAVVVLAVLVLISAALVANAALQVWQRAPQLAVDWEWVREMLDESEPTGTPTRPGATLTAVPATASSSVKPGDPIGRRFADQGTSHVAANTRVTTYNSVPPTSGPHWPTAVPWGLYAASLADEQLVHNLEHGGIVISHNTTDDVVDKLRALRASYGRDRFGSVKIIVRPYELIPRGQIALTAWNWLDVLEAYDEARIRAFVTAHMNQCCEDVP